MSYTPTTWAAGDTVTAAKLNKLEQGVASGGGVFVVNMSNDGQGTLDKTAAEIFEASKSGTVLIKEAHEPTPGVTDWVEAYKTITTAGLDSSGAYSFRWVGDGESSWWSADSGTAYPAFAR